MKGLTKWILIAVSLIFCIHAVAAFGVSSITVDPSGSLTPNTPVIVTFKVDMSASGDETFPNGDELQLSTDLDKPKWSYSLVLDGVDAVQPSNTGRVLSISGWVLSYPSTIEEAVKVTLEGVAPTVTQTTNKTMIRVAEYDSHSNLISSSVVERTAVIVNIAEVQTKVTEKESALQTYRSHIDEKSAMGETNIWGIIPMVSELQSEAGAAGAVHGQPVLRSRPCRHGLWHHQQGGVSARTQAVQGVPVASRGRWWGRLLDEDGYCPIQESSVGGGTLASDGESVPYRGSSVLQVP